ncbi:MAG: four helix bundle protein [Planctomycetes bacterium]|nr:four helix bundle protein [Planctomycetota bacterium]
MSNGEPRPHPADILSDRILDCAARVGKLVDAIPDTRLGRHIAAQLVRSGTSPVGNYEEARSGESRRDFVHKLGICLKELRESRGWIRLLIRTELLPLKKLQPLLDECEQLMNIIGRSIVTAKRAGMKEKPRRRPKT